MLHLFVSISAVPKLVFEGVDGTVNATKRIIPLFAKQKQFVDCMHVAKKKAHADKNSKVTGVSLFLKKPKSTPKSNKPTLQPLLCDSVNNHSEETLEISENLQDKSPTAYSSLSKNTNKPRFQPYKRSGERNYSNNINATVTNSASVSVKDCQLIADASARGKTNNPSKALLSTASRIVCQTGRTGRTGRTFGPVTGDVEDVPAQATRPRNSVAIDLAKQILLNESSSDFMDELDSQSSPRNSQFLPGHFDTKTSEDRGHAKETNRKQVRPGSDFITRKQNLSRAPRPTWSPV